jgi:hypothetical protein
MDFLKDVVDHTRRVAVDALQNRSIESSSPYSPDVPEELRFSMPDLFDRFPFVWPWAKAQPVDPALHTVWILDNTAFRTPPAGDRRRGLEKVKSAKETKPEFLTGDGSPRQLVRGGSGWEVEIVACYFIKNSGKDLSRVWSGTRVKLSPIAHDSR